MEIKIVKLETVGNGTTPVLEWLMLSRISDALKISDVLDEKIKTLKNTYTTISRWIVSGMDTRPIEFDSRLFIADLLETGKTIIEIETTKTNNQFVFSCRLIKCID